MRTRATPPPSTPIDVAPDLDIQAPYCDDCGHRIDTTQHATTCEEQP